MSFLDSSGLDALISAQHDAEVKLGLITVRNPSPRVATVLPMSGITELVAVQVDDFPA